MYGRILRVSYAPKKYVEEKGCPSLPIECIVMNATHHGTFFTYPDFCNCCDYCLKNLAEGEICSIGYPGTLTPKEMCGPSLACTPNKNTHATCQRISSKCTQAQDAFDRRKEDGTLGSFEFRPRCDDDGHYVPEHCVPGFTCYCVAPTGERIFGEIPYLNSWDVQQMSCGCSLHAWKAENTLDPMFPIRVARCLENGLFDPLQCTSAINATCFCVDTVSGAPKMNTEPVPGSELKESNPFCFDPSIHIPGSYEKSCEFEFNSLYEGMKNLGGLKGISDVKLPSCQPDGNYAPVQSMMSKKVCVDPRGVQIENFEAAENSMESNIMNCKCARTRWLLAKSRTVDLPSCCSFGNFQAWQCRRNECFCVDENGDQTEREVDINEIEKLSCYKANEGEACAVP
ncbi:uncharacterized protein LOC105697574 isoform X2 [Orussus abietinus]|uniref:uncharacterized protein LOC105697574 isoform X2 n=1 Tax=Orussus abietinus TaxID=222816 RepID=UPI000625B9CB|nr:uncharacterized protein LOC105697574 isoform X2 [Orussus abietinus]